jgi:hypothetical protein
MVKNLKLKIYLVAAVPALLALHGCKVQQESIPALDGPDVPDAPVPNALNAPAPATPGAALQWPKLQTSPSPKETAPKETVPPPLASASIEPAPLTISPVELKPKTDAKSKTGGAKGPSGGADETKPKQEPPAPISGEWSTHEFFQMYKTPTPHNALQTVYVDNEDRFIKEGAPQKIEFIPETWLYEPLYIENQKLLMKQKQFDLDKPVPLTKDTLVRKT